MPETRVEKLNDGMRWSVVVGPLHLTLLFMASHPCSAGNLYELNVVTHRVFVLEKDLEALVKEDLERG